MRSCRQRRGHAGGQRSFEDIRRNIEAEAPYAANRSLLTYLQLYVMCHKGIADTGGQSTRLDAVAAVHDALRTSSTTSPWM